MGYFRIFARPPFPVRPVSGVGAAVDQIEITLFRNAPVRIGAVNTQDPFTDQTAQLSFPMITPFDTPGEGDLDWLVPNCDINIVWENVGDYEYDWRWEGYIAAFSLGLSGADTTLNVDLKGAFYGLDDYLGFPSFPLRPIPYEILIAQAFDQDEHPCHLGKFRMTFPEDWELTVPNAADPKNYTAAVLKPWGVATGQRWTGFVSRSTGSWEPLLTGFVQNLLSSMFADGGAQWSIRNRGNRRPELYLRTIPDSSNEDIIEIVLGSPGVTLDASRDFTQRAGVIYGSGKDEAQIEFSNIQLSPDGRTTFYKPFAYSSRMWPRKNNPNYDPTVKPKEANIPFQSGVDEVSAYGIAQATYQRFADPGMTGNITLTTDPRLASGELIPRLLIKGGRTIRINGLLGVREGILAHVTEVTADFNSLTVQLTYDTKYRDQLTVAEVRARTRDALMPSRALQVGKYQNLIQDLVLPWSYQAGSGIVPQPAQNFFDQLPPDATFPFEKYTKANPPSKHPNWYIKIGKTNTANSNQNWSCISRDGIPTAAIGIRMSQAGSIRLTQVAAYDKDDNVMPVKFHLSVYDNNSIAVKSMPEFPGPVMQASGDPNPEFPKYLDAQRIESKGGAKITTTYETNTDGDGNYIAQAHPFYKGAWESVQPNGREWPWPATVNIPSDLVVGWGNYYEPAGYSPGRFSKGATRTGVLEDTTSWDWNLTNKSVKVNSNANQSNRAEPYAGMLFVMFYCDDQDDEPVYFMGRFIRLEPGQSG